MPCTSALAPLCMSLRATDALGPRLFWLPHSQPHQPCSSRPSSVPPSAPSAPLTRVTVSAALAVWPGVVAWGEGDARDTGITLSCRSVLATVLNKECTCGQRVHCQTPGSAAAWLCLSAALPRAPPFILKSNPPAPLEARSYLAHTSGSTVHPESSSVCLDSSWRLG